LCCVLGSHPIETLVDFPHVIEVSVHQLGHLIDQFFNFLSTTTSISAG
jgi:hypothetical protein